MSIANALAMDTSLFVRRKIMSSPKVRVKFEAKTKQATDNVNKFSKTVTRFGKKSKQAASGLQTFTNALFSAALIQNIIAYLSNLASKVTGVADSYNLMQARLRLVTESEEEFAQAQEDVLNIARETRSEIDAVADLYVKLKRSLKSAGDETTNIADLTRTITQAMKVSGATNQETEATLLQLGQAFASGVLRGEEFNSVSEQGSRIAQALSDSLGVTIGELRAMAKQGVLTSKVVADALKSQASVIGEEFAQLPLTIGDGIQLVKNSFAEYIGTSDDANSSSEKLAQGIKLIADNFTQLISTLVLVSKAYAILYAVNLLKSAKEKLTAIQQERVERHAAAQAAQAQALVEKELTVSAAQTHAIKTKLALKEAQIAVQRHQQSIQTAKDTIARITLSEKELAIQVRQLKWEIRSNTAKKGTALATKQLIGLKQRHALATDSLRKSTMLLHASENKLTTAIQVQTGAIRSNSAAMSASAAASVGLMGKAKKGIKGLFSQFAKLDVLFAGFLGYELGTWLYDNFSFARKGGVLLVETVEKVISALIFYKDATVAIFSDDTIDQAWDRHVQRLNEINKITDELYNDADKVVQNEQKKNVAYEQTASTRTALTLDGITKISKAEKELQKNQELNVDRNLELEKLALTQRLTDKAEYEAAVKSLESQSLSEKDQLTLDRLTKESELYSEYYDQKIQKLIENNEKMAEQTAKSDEFKTAERLNLTIALESLQLEHNEKIATAQSENNNKILQLEKDKAGQLKRISQETLDALISDANRLANSERDARERAKSVVQEYRDFILKINGDQRTSYQKNADAQKALRDVESKLRESSKAELAGNHKEAQRLSGEALKAAKEIATAQKAYADSADKGSLAQIHSSNNVKKALDLVKDATDAVASSSNNLAETDKTNKEARLGDIKSYTALIKELDELINAERVISAKIDMGTVISQLDTIDSKIKALNQTVTITTKHIGDDGAQVKKKKGGFIPRTDKVPGTGSGDKVKALLEPGEFIMQKSAVQKFGESAMYALNQGKDIIRRKAGGIIPAVKRFAGGGVSDKDGGINGIQRVKSLAQGIFKISGRGDGDESKLAKQLMQQYKKFEQKQIKEIQRPITDERSFYTQQKASALLKYAKDFQASLSGAKDAGGGAVSKIKAFNDELMKQILKDEWRQGTIEEIQYHRAKVLGQSANFIRPGIKINREAKSEFEKGTPFSGIADKESFLRRAEGGSVPGSGLGDSVKALLTPGEHVINKIGVQNFGADFFDSINAGILPEKFFKGGSVGSNVNSAASVAGETISVNLKINGSSAVGLFPKNDDTMNLIEELRMAEASS